MSLGENLLKHFEIIDGESLVSRDVVETKVVFACETFHSLNRGLESPNDEQKRIVRPSIAHGTSPSFIDCRELRATIRRNRRRSVSDNSRKRGLISWPIPCLAQSVRNQRSLRFNLRAAIEVVITERFDRLNGCVSMFAFPLPTSAVAANCTVAISHANTIF
jgi:hypothetical protein